MPDRRQLLRVILLGTAGLAVPAACGLPSGGRPIVDGPGPTAGPGTTDIAAQAPLPQDAKDEASLVRNFLGGVAGKLDTDDDVAAAGERAKAFLTAGAQTSWQPGTQVTVVRMDGDPTPSAGQPGVTLVTAKLEPVGTLQSNGWVKPTAGGVRTVQFNVVPNPDRSGTWLIDDIQTTTGLALTGMLLNSEELNGSSYTPELIYFWSTDADRRGLVPDLRYVPRVGITQEIQRTEVVNWMLAGPSDFLSSAVMGGVYGGITLVGPNLLPPDKDGGLLVNLSGPLPPGPVGPQGAMDQLRWSLRPSYEDPVRLQLNSQKQPQVDGSSNAFLQSNLADQHFRRGEVTAFCVANGVVRPVENPYQLPAAVNDPALNKNVRFAALSRDRLSAALVKMDNRLYVGGASGDTVRFTAVPGLTGGSWTRPAFLPANKPTVMVAVNGGLYVVDVNDGTSAQIGTGTDTVTTITAFAVAPDGHRIALVANGIAWVGALRVDVNGISIGPLQSVDPGLTEPSGIAWSRLDRVLVAGRNTQAGNYQLSEVTIDGAIAEIWSAGGYSAKINSVVALPYLPSISTETGPAMVQAANNNAFYAGSAGSPLPITFKFTGGSSVPTPSASGGAASLGAPTNPFFID